MYKFGKKSKKQLKTCHPDIQLILKEVIKYYDFSVLEGERTQERQKELFEDGKSKLDGTKLKSKHQSTPSLAVDIMPYAKGTNAFSGKKKDTARFYYLAGLVKMAAIKLLEEGSISSIVKWGGDWDDDNIYTDQNFDDLPHFQIKPN